MSRSRYLFAASLPFAFAYAFIAYLAGLLFAVGVFIGAALSAPLTITLHTAAVATRWAQPSRAIGPRSRVLITGAAAGIGREVVLQCAQRGAALVLFDIDGDTLKRTADEAIAVGASRVDARVVDVSDANDVATTVAAVLSTGPITCLISNAGVVGAAADVESGPANAVTRVLGVNTCAAFYLVHALLPSFREARSGSILLVSSAMAFVGAARLAPYCASKAALNALGAALRQELSRDGLAECISVAEVCPYAVQTQMFRGLFDSARAASLLRTLLFPTQLDPTRVAAAIVAAVDRRAQGPVLLPLRQVALLALLRTLPREPAEWLVGHMGGWWGMDGYKGPPRRAVGGHGSTRHLSVGILQGGGAVVPLSAAGTESDAPTAETGHEGAPGGGSEVTLRLSESRTPPTDGAASASSPMVNERGGSDELDATREARGSHHRDGGTGTPPPVTVALPLPVALAVTTTSSST
jgi:all-trans-retinol dehydrogenase (NAD+)